MGISYKKLWKLLVDKGMTKTDLRIAAGISTRSLAKLGRNENVHMETLAKICVALDCGFNDILDFVPVEDSNA